MLKPKLVTSFRQACLTLKAHGYDVIPLREGKATPFKGWPSMPNEETDIAHWNGHAAAVRMHGRDLIVFDFDITIPAVRDDIMGVFCLRWPDFAVRSLHRHSGRIKFAMIGRSAPCKLRHPATWRFIDPADPDGPRLRVEVFTGASRQYVGVWGRHSIENGAEREYGYTGKSIIDMPLAALPVFPVEEIGAVLDACEDIMVAHGLVKVIPSYGKDHKAIVYDIAPATRFDVLDGPSDVDYDELCNMFSQRGELRCSSSFIDGGHNRSKCRVGECFAARCIGVFDHEDMAWHCPADADPAHIVASLGASLKELAQEQGLALPLPVPNWRERYTGSGLPKASFHNAMLAIEASGVVCREDVFHNRRWLTRKDAQPVSYSGLIDDDKLLKLRKFLSNAYGFDLTEPHIRSAAMALAGENSFDPVVEMLARAQDAWDGKPRLNLMAAKTFNCEDNELNQQCVRKTMIAAVARARRPGCKFDTIPVLEAPEGLNKSSAWRTLAGEDNFSDAHILGKADREVQELVDGVWFHEIADLAGMRKADVDTVKAFASRQEDRARPAYGHEVMIRPRRCIIVGTINSDRYLPSQTGNRRFWPLKCYATIDLERLAAEREQLLGEAAHYQALGESLILPETLWATAAVEQEGRRVRDPWEDVLATLSPVPDERAQVSIDYQGTAVVHIENNEWVVSSRVLLEHVLGVPKGQAHAGHTRRLADCMRVRGWHEERRVLKGERQRCYVIPVCNVGM